MSKIDWNAHRNRPRTQILPAELRDQFKEDAARLAKRILSGKPAPDAHRHGPVRKWSAEEISAENERRQRESLK